MNFRIVPSVTWVGLVGIIEDEPPVMKQPEPLGWFAVVFMGLGNAVRKIEVTVIEAERVRKLDKLLLGENLLHLPPERFVHPVIVVGVIKPPFSRYVRRR